MYTILLVIIALALLPAALGVLAEILRPLTKSAINLIAVALFAGDYRLTGRVRGTSVLLAVAPADTIRIALCLRRASWPAEPCVP